MAINELLESNTFGEWFTKINEIITEYNVTDSLSNSLNTIIKNAQSAGQIGSYISEGTSSDYNNYLTNGIYYMSAAGKSNYPVNNIPFMLYVSATSSGIITHIAVSIETSNTRFYIRSKQSTESNWSTWNKLLSDIEAEKIYLPISGGTIENLITSNLTVNGIFTANKEVDLADKLVFKNDTKNITLDSDESSFFISVPSSADTSSITVKKPFVLNLSDNTCTISGLISQADALTEKGLTSDYKDTSTTLAATGKAVSDLYEFITETYMTTSGGQFSGIVEFDEDLIVKGVIYSSNNISFRPTDKVQIVSNSNFSELFLDKDNEPVETHPHVLGTRRRTGITNYNIGTLVFDTSCIELSEDYCNIRLRKINSSTLDEEKSNLFFNFSRESITPSLDNSVALGAASNRFTQVYASSDSINTSDRNMKQDFALIDKNLLENWGNVQWCSFKFKDSVSEKGDKARIHTGLVAQDLFNTLEDYNIDASKYGFFCHDSWDDVYDTQYIMTSETDADGNVSEVQKEIKTLIKKAGEQYSLRYQEIQAIENAYLRKQIDMLKSELTSLKKLYTTSTQK